MARKRRVLLSLLLLGFVVSIISSGGCGGKKSTESPAAVGAPAGTYYLAIKANSHGVSRLFTNLILIVR
jgi:hypothetical protein